MFFKKKEVPKVKRKETDCPKYVSPSVFKPNKCGAKANGFYKLTYYLIPNLVFGSSCNCHDFAYFVGGCKKFQNNARFLADEEFLRDMKATIQTVYFWRRPLLLKLADLYFWAVRKAGHESFNWFETVEEFIEHLGEIGFDRSNFEGLEEALAKEALDFVQNAHKFTKENGVK